MLVMTGWAWQPASAAERRCNRYCFDEVASKDDRFVGQAVLYVPGRGKVAASKDHSSGSECTGCEWMLSPACLNNSVTRERGSDALCEGAVAVCPRPGEVSFRVYFRRSEGEPWKQVDQVCLGADSQPVTSAQVAAAVREPFEKLVPKQRPGFQPAGGALVHLPTIFYSGQPQATDGTVEVLGLDVTIRARPTWRWRFDTGVERTFHRLGGRYPNKDVTHTYPTTGRRVVVVVTEWRGTYAVNGQAPQPIPAPVVQTSSPLPVEVFEARSQLVAGAG